MFIATRPFCDPNWMPRAFSLFKHLELCRGCVKQQWTYSLWEQITKPNSFQFFVLADKNVYILTPLCFQILWFLFSINTSVSLLWLALRKAARSSRMGSTSQTWCWSNWISQTWGVLGSTTYQLCEPGDLTSTSSDSVSKSFFFF